MKDKKQMIKYTAVLAIEIACVILVLAIDLITKYYVYTPLADTGDTTVAIKGVLEFYAVENTGASFGLFEGTVVALGIVSLVASIAVAAVMVLTLKLKNPLLDVSLVLILGGALGNMFDRLALGYVRDFVHFPWADFFGYFNIADNALTIGTVLAVVYLIFFYSSDMKKLDDAKKAALPTDTAVETTPDCLVEKPENSKENPCENKTDKNNENDRT